MVRRILFGVLAASCLFAQDLRIVKVSKPLLPGEGQAINKLITGLPKIHYKSRVNEAFRNRLQKDAVLDRVDTVKVLALRVEFQEDTSSLTTGNGKMDYAGFLSPSDGLLYDPPHTRGYFQELMKQLKNYYALNSLGKFCIESNVMPSTVFGAYELPHDMLYYGDTTSTEGVETGLCRLMRDAIKVADLDPEIRFSDYDLVVIFHAGSTAQTDLALDSPFDLLTGTVDTSALEAYLGEPYVLADEGRTKITAASIYPEMARQDTLYQGQLNILGMDGVEGLVDHEFCHLLGGYDLYDVTYNSMGVGSWSIMGYGGWLGDWGLGVPPGTIPSLLDAYHKVLFGWIKPLVVNLPKGNIPLFAAEMDSLLYSLRGDSLHPVVVKVPISPTEYYLIENRETDIKHKDTLFVHVEGGIPVSVGDGEYDFFQPGSGVIVWHIDQSVIDEYGPYNAVNIFPDHKGVKMVEADGIQDYDQFSGRSSYDYQIYGYKFDPFFTGGMNDSLTDRTTPSSAGYYGKTFISLGVSSGPDTVMPIGVTFDLFQPGFPQSAGTGTAWNAATCADINQSGHSQIIASDTSGALCVWNADGTSFLAGHAAGSFARLPNGATTHSALAAGDICGDNHLELVCGADDGKVYAFTASGGVAPGFPKATTDRVTAAPVLCDLDHDGKQEIIVGSTDGYLYVWRGDGTNYPHFPVRLGSEIRAAVALTDLAHPRIAALGSDGNLFLVDSDATIAPGFPKSLGTGSLYTYAAPVVGDIDRDGNKEIVCVVSGGYDYKIVTVGLDGTIRYHSQTRIRNPFFGTPALGDINQDGYLEPVLASYNGIYAFNRNGTPVSGFPLEQESTYVTTFVANGYLISVDYPFMFNSSPVLGDVNGDGNLDVIIGSPEFGVLGFNGLTGKKLDYFPLATTAGVSATPLICDIDHDGETEIAVGSDDGIFHVWKLPGNPASLAWGGYLKDPSHTGLYSDQELPTRPEASRQIIDKFYIYPNPAGDLAYARFRLGTASNASARVKILDVSGLPLMELTASAYASADNEQSFDVKQIPSGVYLARLEVKCDQGTAVKFCKLAIVR
jgi:M6 family metalloprotease-like protein